MKNIARFNHPKNATQLRSAEFQLSNFAAAMRDLQALLKQQPGNRYLTASWGESSLVCLRLVLGLATGQLGRPASA